MNKIPRPTPRAICDDAGELWRVHSDGALTWLWSEDYLQEPAEFYGPERNHQFTPDPGPVEPILFSECQECGGTGEVEHIHTDFEEGFDDGRRAYRKVTTIDVFKCPTCNGMGHLHDWSNVKVPSLAAYLESIGIKREVAA